MTVTFQQYLSCCGYFTVSDFSINVLSSSSLYTIQSCSYFAMTLTILPFMVLATLEAVKSFIFYPVNNLIRDFNDHLMP